MYIQYLAESFHNSPNWKLFDSAWTPHLRDVQGAARAFRWLAVEGFDVPGQDLRKTRVALTQRLYQVLWIDTQQILTIFHTCLFNIYLIFLLC